MNYTARRQRLAADLKTGLIVLPANTYQPFNYVANTQPFRQDSTFLYFAGLDLPDMILVIDVDNHREILFGHDPTIDDIIWEGPLPALLDQANGVGIKQVRESADFGKYLKNALENGQKIHYLKPYQAEIHLRLMSWLGTAELSPSIDLIKAIVAQRSYKDAEEIKEIEAAMQVTQEIYRFAMGHTRPGVHEYEIVGGVLGIAGAHHSQMAYSPIFSVNGHVLHNHHYGNIMQAGQWVVADLGAESPGTHYASDLTRTWPISGKFSSVQRDIYTTVLKSYEAAVAHAKPGVAYRDCHLLAWAVIAEGLQSMGILKPGDPVEMANEGVVGLFMPHGLGHALGLDVHDMENLGEEYVGYDNGQIRSNMLGLKSLRMARPLEEGFVMTVEPGIYFIPPLIDRWEAEGKFADFIDYSRLKQFHNAGGCRLEDDYLITSEGAQMIGAYVPRTIEEVEAAVGTALS